MMQTSEKPVRTTKQIGDEAEQIAFEYLLQQGYTLIRKKFFYKNVGELDLVMYDGPTIVFIEVRFRKNRNYGLPEASIGPGKQRKIRRTAEAFLLRFELQNRPCRFDVVAMDLIGGSTVIRHIKNCI